MANVITSHTKIPGVRDDLKTAASRVQKSFRELSAADYVSRGGMALADRAPVIRKIFNEAEEALTKAHRCANALAGVKKVPKASNVPFSVTRYTPGKIVLDSNHVQSHVTVVRDAGHRLENDRQIVIACRREFENLKVTDQLVSTLDVVDAMFPVGVLGKAALIAYVKEEATKQLYTAAVKLDMLSSYFLEAAHGVMEGAAQLSEVEEKVRRSFFEDKISRTSQITKDNKPSQKEIKQEVGELERMQAEYTLIYGAPSAEIAAEIQRLKKLMVIEVEVPLKGQKTNYTCGSASGSMILAALGVNVSEEDVYAYAGRGGYNPTGVERLKDTINHFLGCKAYRVQQTYGWSDQQYINLIKSSLEKGYPVQALIRANSKQPLGYSTKGHYFVITGIYQDDKGVWRVKINDPWSKNAYGKKPSPTNHDLTIEQLRKLNNAHSANLIVATSASAKG
ncbi:MAG: C39 family peptidase [Lachnospiraceae bacterium]|nr:C39 family peptidase [Lachnospiraceae bacterium]